MNENAIKIRLMKADDFDAVVGIDEKILETSRPEYYEVKFEKLFTSKDYLPASLVAENEDRTVVGFVMGEIYPKIFEFCIVSPSEVSGFGFQVSGCARSNDNRMTTE